MGVLPPALAWPYARRAAPSSLPEHMDGETDFKTFEGTLRSLASVNEASFGYRPITRFLARSAERGLPGRPLRIVDAGSGYGDGLRAAGKWLARRGIAAELVGVDINPHAARAASAATPPSMGEVKIYWQTDDIFTYIDHAPPPDLVISSLFCHHLEDDELPRFLHWMDGAAGRGWLINDLHRSRFAAGGFAVLAHLLRKHPYVRHDGPVSFARSFRRSDWERHLEEAGIEGARISLQAPFRLCVEKHAAG
jgi:SAM-dependent methyltransferase